jgi:hypothetical protein
VALSDVFEKLGRTIFESPFSAARLAEEAPELAEIRLAAMDAIKSRSHRVSGKLVFPYNMVRIRLIGIPEKDAEAFRSEFLANYLAGELREGLTRSHYRFPDDLRVEMETAPELPGPQAGWIQVETESIPSPKERPAVRDDQQAVLLIMQGTANVPELPLAKVRTNIGRTIDVFKSAGPSRRNDLAFAEDTEINRSVSREHAHIMLDRTSGDYRIINDRWYKTGPEAEANCGLWIVRDGLSQPIHRNSRGVALKPFDEIHFGQAIVQFLLR